MSRLRACLKFPLSGCNFGFWPATLRSSAYRHLRSLLASVRFVSAQNQKFRYRAGDFRQALTGFLLIVLSLMSGSHRSLSAFSWGLEQTKEYRTMARRARIALENRQWHEALMILEQGKRRFSRVSRIRLALAYLYRQLGLFDQAREQAQWASRRMTGKEREEAYRELAWANFKLFLFEEALEALGHVKNRLDADWALEGRVYAEMKQWSQALISFESIAVPSPLIVFWKAWCWWNMGRFEEAQPVLAAGAHPGARAMFSSSIPAGINDPWVLLGHQAQRYQRDQPLLKQDKLHLERFSHPGSRKSSIDERFENPDEFQARELARELTERLIPEP